MPVYTFFRYKSWWITVELEQAPHGIRLERVGVEPSFEIGAPSHWLYNFLSFQVKKLSFTCNILLVNISWVQGINLLIWVEGKWLEEGSNI